jgi:hypothetical protein
VKVRIRLHTNNTAVVYVGLHKVFVSTTHQTVDASEYEATAVCRDLWKGIRVAYLHLENKFYTLLRKEPAHD